MSKLIAFLISSSLLFCVPVRGDDKPQEIAFWSSMQNKIDHLKPGKLSSMFMATGGMRLRTDAHDWKGEGNGRVIEAEELAAFKSALSLVRSGEYSEAHSRFDRFLQEYPESRLSVDARHALELLEADRQAR